MGQLYDQTLQDFSATGVLSGARGFEFRPQQQEMAGAVARALNCEFTAALLKGRANYLCKTRLRRALEQASDLFNQAETKQLHDLQLWFSSGAAGEGSLAELPAELNSSPKVWAQVCSENHVCTPRNCGPDCPYQAARRRVQDARVAVLNHTLFFGLLALAEETAPEDEEAMQGFIFPGDFVILDEAHTIETVAAHQLGLNLSEAELTYDLLRLYNPHTHKETLRRNATPNLLRLIEEAQVATEEFFRAARADCQLDAHHGTVRLRGSGWTEDILSPVLQELYKEVRERRQRMKTP